MTGHVPMKGPGMAPARERMQPDPMPRQAAISEICGRSRIAGAAGSGLVACHVHLLMRAAAPAKERPPHMAVKQVYSRSRSRPR